MRYKKTDIRPFRPDPKTVSFLYFFEKLFMMNGSGQGPVAVPFLEIHRSTCRELEDLFFCRKAALSGSPIQYAVINMPPRIGKTMLMCAFVAWAFTINPRSQWIYASYAQKVADMQCKMIQDIMRQDWYTKLFNVRLGSMQQVGMFTTTAGGKFYAAGNDSAMIGFGAGSKVKYGGFIILDDPQNPREALNPILTEQLHRWFEGTCMSRRNSDIYCPIVIVQQRLSKGDLSGYVLSNYQHATLHIKYPALLEIGPHNEKNIEEGWETAIPGTMSVTSLLEKRERSRQEFCAMYQQEPILEGGNMIPIGRIRTFKSSDVVERMDYDMKVITCDTAMMVKQASDWSVIMCWIKLGNKAYLIDMRRGKWESPQLTSMLHKFYNLHNDVGKPVRKVVIEEALCGLNYLQSLKQAGLPVEGLIRHRDKSCRVQDILNYVYNEQVYIPEEAVWKDALLQELAEFDHYGKHAHDDQVDAFADGVSYCLSRPMNSFDTMGTPRGLMSGIFPKMSP